MHKDYRNVEENITEHGIGLSKFATSKSVVKFYDDIN